jgi:hypothetical protein
MFKSGKPKARSRRSARPRRLKPPRLRSSHLPLTCALYVRDVLIELVFEASAHSARSPVGSALGI